MTEQILSRFKINLLPNGDSRIEMDGKLLGGVTRFSVEIDTMLNKPVVHMTMMSQSVEGEVLAELPEEQRKLTAEEKAQFLKWCESALDGDEVQIQTNQSKDLTIVPADIGTRTTFKAGASHKLISIRSVTQKKAP